MITVRRMRPDPLLLLAATTLAGIGVALQGLAARLVLTALAVPVAITERRQDRQETHD